MFNFTGVLLSVVNGAVVDKPTSDFTGNAATIQTTSNNMEEFIFFLLVAFIAGIYTHYAYVEIKKYIKNKRKTDAKKPKEVEEDDKNERE